MKKPVDIFCKIVLQAIGAANQMEQGQTLLNDLLEEEKMNKCEWKDGELNLCDTVKDHIELIDDLSMLTRRVSPESMVSAGFNYCAFCGADIRKPEPAVIIKRSGEMWIKRENGFDYYWPRCAKAKPVTDSDFWQVFPKEITDEIAKLRPMIKKPENIMDLRRDITLIRVNGGKAFYEYNGFLPPRECLLSDWITIDNCHLATVEDLP